MEHKWEFLCSWVVTGTFSAVETCEWSLLLSSSLAYLCQNSHINHMGQVLLQLVLNPDNLTSYQNDQEIELCCVRVDNLVRIHQQEASTTQGNRSSPVTQ